MVRVFFIFKSIRVIYSHCLCSVYVFFVGLFVSLFLFLYIQWSMHFGLCSECHIFMVADLFCSLFTDWLAGLAMLSPYSYSLEFLCSTYNKLMKIWFSNANYRHREKPNNYKRLLNFTSINVHVPIQIQRNTSLNWYSVFRPFYFMSILLFFSTAATVIKSINFVLWSDLFVAIYLSKSD